MSLLEVNNLTLRFGGLTAVNKVSFKVEPGQIFSIIGPNGAGKTTVFNAISGVYQPTEGEILLKGIPFRRALTIIGFIGFALVVLLTGLGAFVLTKLQTFWEVFITNHYVYQQQFPWSQAWTATADFARQLPWTQSWLPGLIGSLVALAACMVIWRSSRRTPEVIVKRGVARTFQNIRLFQQMSALDNLLVGMERHLKTGFWHIVLRLPLFWQEKEKATREAREILQFVGLDQMAHLRANQLAYGHQRRLEIARALATRPALLLLDEPAAGMNPSEISDLIQLIRKIRDSGVTILLIEHHMQVVMGISDQVAVLDYGNKIAEGTPAQVKSNPRVIEAYLGKVEEGK